MSSAIFLMLMACGDGAEDSGSVTSNPVLVDANNYQYVGDLEIAATEVEAQQDVDIDWSGLVADLQAQPIDPAADIDQLELILFRYLSRDEVEQALSNDTLLQADIDLFLQHRNTEQDTTALLSEFGLLGNKVDISEHFVEENGTWLLLLASGTVPGSGTRMLHFVVPTVSTDNHAVSIDDSSTELKFEVSLHDLRAVASPAGTTGTIDWSNLTRDGRGNPLALTSIDEVWLAHYDTDDLSALEKGFLGLEDSASELYRLATDGGTTANLADLSSAGASFSGLTTDGTWLLSLRCTTCFNPAPPFLTLFDVR